MCGWYRLRNDSSGSSTSVRLWTRGSSFSSSRSVIGGTFTGAAERGRSRLAAVSEREGEGRAEGLEELLLRRLRGVEHELGRDVERAVPAWLRETPGESRWAVSFTLVMAMVLQALLPDRFAVQPRWLLLVPQVALLAAVVIANPIRIERPSTFGRTASLALTVVFSLAN